MRKDCNDASWQRMLHHLARSAVNLHFKAEPTHCPHFKFGPKFRKTAVTKTRKVWPVTLSITHWGSSPQCIMSWNTALRMESPTAHCTTGNKYLTVCLAFYGTTWEQFRRNYAFWSRMAQEKRIGAALPSLYDEVPRERSAITTLKRRGLTRLRGTFCLKILVKSKTHLPQQQTETSQVLMQNHNRLSRLWFCIAGCCQVITVPVMSKRSLPPLGITRNIQEQSVARPALYQHPALWEQRFCLLANLARRLNFHTSGTWLSQGKVELLQCWQLSYKFSSTALFAAVGAFRPTKCCVWHSYANTSMGEAFARHLVAQQKARTPCCTGWLPVRSFYLPWHLGLQGAFHSPFESCAWLK